MTPELLWALIFTYECRTTEVIFYERRTTEITRHCDPTPQTYQMLPAAVPPPPSLQKVDNVPQYPAASLDVPKAPKKVAKKTKRKPCKKGRTRNKRGICGRWG